MLCEICKAKEATIHRMAAKVTGLTADSTVLIKSPKHLCRDCFDAVSQAMGQAEASNKHGRRAGHS